MRPPRWILLLLAALATTVPCRADPFIDAVVDQYLAPPAAPGPEFPEIVLGGPEGTGDLSGSLHVQSLGDGGWIELAFQDNCAGNGPGPDLLIFENAFQIGGNPEVVFAEVAFVEVSEDGLTWFRFPNEYAWEPEDLPEHPDHWTGFAGVRPVQANSGNGIDPTDPVLAGGDAFDFDEIPGFDPDCVWYVRILDTGEPPENAADDLGRPVEDPGWPSGLGSGFDLDAVAAVHSRELPADPLEPAPRPTATPVRPYQDRPLSGIR